MEISDLIEIIILLRLANTLTGCRIGYCKSLYVVSDCDVKPMMDSAHSNKLDIETNIESSSYTINIETVASVGYEVG